MVKVASWRDSRKTVKVSDPPEKLPPPYDTHRHTSKCPLPFPSCIPVHRTGAGHTFDSICIGRFPMIGGDSWLMTSNRKCGILNHRWDSESFKLEQRLNYGIPVVAMVVAPLQRSGSASGSRFVPNPNCPNPSVFLEMRGFAPCTDHERTSLP